MALQIGRAITDGIDRTMTKTGGILLAVLLVYQILFVGSVNTVTASFLPEEAAQGIGLTLPIPVEAAGVLLAVGYLFSIVFFIVVARAMTRPMAELGTFPKSLYTRRIGRATLSAIGGGIIYFVSVMIGLVLLVIPGLFLAISFMFYVFAIGIEDARAIGSLKRSWNLTSGNRLRLFLLVVVVGVTVGIVSSLGSFAGLAISMAVGEVISLVLASVLGVFGYGIVADAFVQLRETDDEDESGEAKTVAPGGTAV